MRLEPKNAWPEAASLQTGAKKIPLERRLLHLGMTALLKVNGTDDGRRERDADGVGEAGIKQTKETM
jgi:hypothetical protein